MYEYEKVQNWHKNSPVIYLSFEKKVSDESLQASQPYQTNFFESYTIGQHKIFRTFQLQRSKIILIVKCLECN